MNRSTDTANPRGKEAQGAVSDSRGLRKEGCTWSADLGIKTLRLKPLTDAAGRASRASQLSHRAHGGRRGQVVDQRRGLGGTPRLGPQGSPEGRSDNLPTQQEWTTSNGKSDPSGW